MKDNGKLLPWIRAIAMLLAVLVLGSGAFIGVSIKRIHDVTMDIEEVSENLNNLSRELKKVDWDSLSEGVNNVSRQLSELDIESMTARLDDLTRSAGQSIETASRAIEAFDVEALNRTVKALESIAEPLSRLVGIFR